MHLTIDLIIYGYLLVCVLLVLFNVFYIFYSQALKNAIAKHAIEWERAIKDELTHIDDGVSGEHLSLIQKKIVNTNAFLGYSRAVEGILGSSDEKVRTGMRKYLDGCESQYHRIARIYSRRDTMDKAFAAYFISMTTRCYKEEESPIYRIMMDYAEDSSVYCRENLLKAFYAFGNCQALFNFMVMQKDLGFTHHKKLLSDGLMTFKGDKEKLAELLWDNRSRFSVNTQLAIIAFITGIQADYRESVFAELERDDHDEETAIAYIRYFRRHKYEPAGERLREIMESDADTNIKIVVASVLSAYPCRESIDVLKKSLGSSNWYVRFNSANSLLDIGLSKEDEKSILDGKDRYARDMLIYAMEKREGA